MLSDGILLAHMFGCMCLVSATCIKWHKVALSAWIVMHVC